MTTEKNKDFLDKQAIIVSVIFHPLLMPVYGLAIIFSAPTLFGYLPFAVKKLLFIIVLVNNVFLPLTLLPLFRYKQLVKSWYVEERSERVFPLLIVTILYSVSSFIVFRFPIPVFLKSFIFSAFFISLLVTVINLWWKISIHSAGAGALTSLVLILSLKMYSPLLSYLIIVVIASGLVLSSRLKLNSHSPGQVWFGFLTGFLGLGLFMWFF